MPTQHLRHAARPWLPATASDREAAIRRSVEGLDSDAIAARLGGLIARNREIHEVECINLNPATNVMNPVAEAALAAGLGSRPSLGWAGMKYEMGLEAIEEIEVVAADLVRQVFGCAFAELRVASGALANLYAFMATCRPGDTVIVPPATIAGHVTHRGPGAAGLYGVRIVEAPIAADDYSIDIAALADLAAAVRPRLITVGSSLNLFPHPVAEIRTIADGVGADVLFDAAHACGMFAGGRWPNPLDEGADLMTMSTYKSLGGPAGGLVLTNRADLAERLDSIAYPGLTANYDAGKTAALALTMLDWIEFGEAYAAQMVATASALADALRANGVPLYETTLGATSSHQFAVDARRWGGGHEAALRLRDANILACAIGLPDDEGAGLRLGTPEVVRWGMTPADMPAVADLIADALHTDAVTVAGRTSEFRRGFAELHYIRR